MKIQTIYRTTIRYICLLEKLLGTGLAEQGKKGETLENKNLK